MKTLLVKKVIKSPSILNYSVMSIGVPEKDLGRIIDKLDEVRLEILRLRATLLPGEEPTLEEKRALEEARKEIAAGESLTLEELLRDIS